MPSKEGVTNFQCGVRVPVSVNVTLAITVMRLVEAQVRSVRYRQVTQTKFLPIQENIKRLDLALILSLKQHFGKMRWIETPESSVRGRMETLNITAMNNWDFFLEKTKGLREFLFIALSCVGLFLMVYRMATGTKPGDPVQIHSPFGK
jgi:hypothetical protein